MTPTRIGEYDLRAPIAPLLCSQNTNTPEIRVLPAFWAILSLVPLKYKIKHHKIVLKFHGLEKNKSKKPPWRSNKEKRTDTVEVKRLQPKEGRGRPCWTR